jgi:hypothetical protein
VQTVSWRLNYAGNRIWYIWYIFINCSWVATRWQQYSTHLHTNSTQNDTKQTIHRTTQKLERVRAVSRLYGCYPGICLTTEEKFGTIYIWSSALAYFPTILTAMIVCLCLFVSRGVRSKPWMYCSLLAYCTVRLRLSNFVHQMPPRLPTRSAL